MKRGVRREVISARIPEWKKKATRGWFGMDEQNRETCLHCPFEICKRGVCPLVGGKEEKRRGKR